MDSQQRYSIFARNCQVRSITRQEAFQFMNENHRLGGTHSKYNYGLFIKISKYDLSVGSLVAVASFSKPRRWKKSDLLISSYEWVRYASLYNFRVVGGMAKLLSFFISNVNPDDIMTYIDPRYNTGESYLSLGFVKEDEKVFDNGNLSVKFRLKIKEY